MKRLKKIAIALCVVIIVIQFIQPAHNKSVQVFPADFSTVYKLPVNIQSIFQNACYDCHSNNTSYPWYSNIQPVAWMMARHIKKGKAKLNFNEFGKNSIRKQISKLKEIYNQVKDDEMPLSSYKLMHKKARLSQQKKMLLINWLQATADSLSANN
ncbi:MAG TPA: heme-binding domain-containing protein [Chitinophagaceae bacterium]|nr:heme-binding domain-containing protein [Chitinophagaceae bacterium]